jgi:hypothetical protein
MLLRRGIPVLALVAAVAFARDSSAGLVKYFTGEAVGGAVEKVEPALARTLADVDSRLTKQEDHLEGVAGGLIGKASSAVGDRLGQVDGILEKRLLQVQLGADEVVDNGLDKVDGVARRRIAQVGSLLDHGIDKVDGDVAKMLDHADQILAKNLGNVDKIVTGAIDQADGALAARIEQLDEVAGRRLGNVDVIATKQRLGLERTITRAAWLIALIVFIIVVLKALWNEYLDAENELRLAKPGTERALRYVKVLGAPLLRHAAVGAIVAALLATVPERLPMAAAKDQQSLINYHRAELERSFTALDWTHVRFHASQLEMLEAPGAAHYQAVQAKADLLRDLLGRPTNLSTLAGANAILERVRAVERLEPGRLDPDAVTARAMILWQRGTQKSDEHQAAALAGRALWSTPRGFTMAPMARLLVEAYLHAPDPAPADDLESALGLNAILAMETRVAPGSPFEGAATLFHLMEALDTASSAAFIEMVEAQGVVSAPETRRDPTALAKALDERNGAAQRVVDAWVTFDTGLRSTPVLSTSPLVLGAFRLDDVALCHALWFTTQPETLAWPKRLSEMTQPTEVAHKVAIAPARVTWARRYAALLAGPARELVELQEARRFEALEDATLAFEHGYGADSRPEVGRSKAKARPAQVKPDAELDGLAKASGAAALGLYEGAPGARTPLAVKLGGTIEALEKKEKALLEKLQASTAKSAKKLDANLNQKLDDAKAKAIQKLGDRLVGRGPRLI